MYKVQIGEEDKNENTVFIIVFNLIKCVTVYISPGSYLNSAHRVVVGAWYLKASLVSPTIKGQASSSLSFLQVCVFRGGIDLLAIESPVPPLPATCVSQEFPRGWGGPAWLAVPGRGQGDHVSSPQAVDSRDSLAMALYARCFEWVIKKINSRIKGKDDFKSIGILDIFGFENFEVCFHRWDTCILFYPLIG